MTKRKIEIMVGTFFALFSLVFYFIAPHFVSMGLVSNYSPYEYPQWLSLMVFITSIIHIIRSVMSKARESFVFTENIKDFFNVLKVLAISIIFVILFKKLGFILSSILFLLAFCYMVRLKIKTALLITGILPFLLFYVFYFYMEIRLPTGFIEKLIFPL